MEQQKRVRHWDRQDRPRDRLYEKKPYELATAELLAMIIGPGNAQCNGLQLAQNVLASCNHQLSELSKRSVGELMKIRGIGRTKASAIVAFAELSRRREIEKAVEKECLKSSTDTAAYLSPRFRDLNYEAFGVLFLNSAGQIIKFEMVSAGGISSTTVDIRLVLKNALLIQAISIIACCNRVAGPPKVESADSRLASQLHSAARHLDIKVLDYIIIGENSYHSMADNDQLGK